MGLGFPSELLPCIIKNKCEATANILPELKIIYNFEESRSYFAKDPLKLYITLEKTQERN